MTTEAAGKLLYEITVDDRSYSNAMAVFGQSDKMIFHAEERDTSMYSALMPEIAICERNDLRILRIEMMHFYFFVVDYLLTRAGKVHEQFGFSLCYEMLHCYVLEFKNRIDPIGKSQEFVASCEERLRAYNRAWDKMLADGEKRNRLLIETILFQFCRPESPVVNVAVHWTLQYQLLANQMALFSFFDNLRIS